jgi:DNA-binding transcriptional ArsR family regulator
LANKNAEVVIAVRSIEKGNKAADRIRSQNAKANVRVLKSAHLVSDERQGQEVLYSINALYIANLFEKTIKLLQK